MENQLKHRSWDYGLAYKVFNFGLGLLYVAIEDS